MRGGEIDPGTSSPSIARTQWFKLAQLPSVINSFNHIHLLFFLKMPSLPLPVSSIHLGALVTSVLEPSSHIANVISTPCFLTFTFHYISLFFVFAFIILHLTFKRKNSAKYMWTRLSWRLASLPAIVSLSLVPTNVPLRVTLLACRWITRVYCPPRSHATFNCVNIPGGSSPVLQNRVRWSLLAALLCLLLDDFKRRLTMELLLKYALLHRGSDDWCSSNRTNFNFNFLVANCLTMPPQLWGSVSDLYLAAGWNGY